MPDPAFGYDDRFAAPKPRKKRRNRPAREQPAPAALLARSAAELAASDWLRNAVRCLRDALADRVRPVRGADLVDARPEAKVKVEAEAKTQDEGEGEGEREADLKVEAGAETGAEARTPGCICLGLGSPAASRDARAQLAFLLEACDALELDRGAIPVFDPVFSDEDHALLSELGLQPTAEDKQARYALEDTTLAYMPHCDLQLYENLLRANWTRAALPRVVLIANRLSEYADSMPSRRLSAEYPCVARIVSRLTVQPLPPWPAHPTAFNNTAVQYARADALAQPPEDWWALPAAAPSPAPE